MLKINCCETAQIVLILTKKGDIMSPEQQLIKLTEENERLKKSNAFLQRELEVTNRTLEDLSNIPADDQLIVLDYPLHCHPRYTVDHPHQKIYEILNRNRKNFETSLKIIEKFKGELSNIPKQSENKQLPTWINEWLPPFDSATLYTFLRFYQPQNYVEIGSGISTKFARQAIQDGNLQTKIISIDPQPRNEIDSLCNKIFRMPVEEMDPAYFKTLQSGDILFVDGTHRVFENSDVIAVFLDIIPQLAPGVIVQIHDILLPYDYSEEWTKRYYSEQYLLAAYLLAEGEHLKLLQCNTFISHDKTLKHVLAPLWKALSFDPNEMFGSSFWFQTA